MEMDRTLLNTERWFKFWNNKIEEIKKSKLSRQQAITIYESFLNDLQSYKYFPELHKEYQRFGELIHSMIIALEISYSRYRDSRRSIWDIFRKDGGLKMPDINLIKLGMKNEK